MRAEPVESVRLRKQQLDQIREIARRQRRTLTEQMAIVMEDWLALHAPWPKRPNGKEAQSS